MEHLPHKQYIVGSTTRAALFSLKKEMFKLVVLPCFDLGLTVPMDIPYLCEGMELSVVYTCSKVAVYNIRIENKSGHSNFRADNVRS